MSTPSVVTAVPPARWEFGLLVRYHVPAVRALSRPVVVCHEPGLEALYPDATHVLVDRREDHRRKDAYAKDRDFVQRWERRLSEAHRGCRIVRPDRSGTWPEERFLPEPFESQGVGEVDIVVCPRRRMGGEGNTPEKRRDIEMRNWGAWPELTDRLRSSGLEVFAAGLEETSYPLGSPAAWDYDRPLDATIEAMRSARLVLATDSGLAHLAVLCGRPLLMVTAGGRPAPGYPWEVRWSEYYERANWTGAPIRRVDAWGSVDRVMDAVDECLVAA